MEAIVEYIIENKNKLPIGIKIIVIFKNGYDLIVKIMGEDKTRIFMTAKDIFDGLYDNHPCFIIDDNFEKNTFKYEISNSDLNEINKKIKEYLMSGITP